MKFPPDFIIAGAPKCGSSLLYTLLDKHHMVEMSKSKEPNFYYNNWGKDTTPIEYNNLEGKVRGEASVGYFDRPEVAQRIKKINPNTKLIFCLRNPVERTYSHYWHRVKSGEEHRKWNKVLGKPDFNEYLFSFSLYGRNLNYYLKEFDKTQIYLYDLDRYKKRPNTVWSEVQGFLNLPVIKVKSPNQIVNKGKAYKSLLLQVMAITLKKRSREVPRFVRKLLAKPYKYLLRFNETQLNVNDISDKDYLMIADLLKADQKKFQLEWQDCTTRWLA